MRPVAMSTSSTDAEIAVPQQRPHVTRLGGDGGQRDHRAGAEFGDDGGVVHGGGFGVERVGDQHVALAAGDVVVDLPAVDDDVGAGLEPAEAGHQPQADEIDGFGFLAGVEEQGEGEGVDDDAEEVAAGLEGGLAVAHAHGGRVVGIGVGGDEGFELLAVTGGVGDELLEGGEGTGGLVEPIAGNAVLFGRRQHLPHRDGGRDVRHDAQRINRPQQFEQLPTDVSVDAHVILQIPAVLQRLGERPDDALHGLAEPAQKAGRRSTKLLIATDARG